MRDKENVKKDAVPEVLREPHRYAIRPFRIAGNLYYVGNTSVGAHLIDTGGGLLLIDTAYSRTLPLLVNSIWEAGFSPYDIKYILHSHGHYDHFGGTNELAALSKAKTFLGAEDARMFRERPELALAPPSCPYCYEKLFTPDFEMEDGGIISLGNTEIKTVWTPGHSPGVMSFIITVTDGDTRYSAGMHGGSGLNTLNIEFLKKYKLDPEKTRNDFLLSLKKLKKEKVDITLGNHPDQNRTVEKREKTLKNPDALGVAYADWYKAYEPTLKPHTPPETAERNRVKKTAEKALREFVNRFLRHDPVTDYDRDIMRIPNRKKTRTGHIEVTETVSFVFRLKDIRQVWVDFRVKGAAGRGKPDGYDGAIIIWAILNLNKKR